MGSGSGSCAITPTTSPTSQPLLSSVVKEDTMWRCDDWGPCESKDIKVDSSFTRPPEGIDFYVDCDSPWDVYACYQTEIGPTSGTAADRPDDVYACCRGYHGKSCNEMEVNAKGNAVIECTDGTAGKAKEECKNAVIRAVDVKVDCTSPLGGEKNCKGMDIYADGNVVLLCSGKKQCESLEIKDAVNVEIECAGHWEACKSLTATYSGTCTCTETSSGDCPSQSSFTGPAPCTII